jgi:hypothetical protein
MKVKDVYYTSVVHTEERSGQTSGEGRECEGKQAEVHR